MKEEVVGEDLGAPCDLLLHFLSLRERVEMLRMKMKWWGT